MSSRERLLALAVGLVLGYLALEWLVERQFLAPLRDLNSRIASVHGNLQTKQAELAEGLQAEHRIEQWRELALPADRSVAQTGYMHFLRTLLTDAGIANPNVTAQSPVAKDRDTLARLPFQVGFRGDLRQVTRFLSDFRRARTLHQLSRINFQPVIEKGKLVGFDVALSIEAASMADAKANEVAILLSDPEPGMAASTSILVDVNPFQPTRLAPATPAMVVDRLPPAPRDDRERVEINGTTVVDGVGTIWLYNRETKEKMQVREGEELRIPGMVARVVKASPDQILLKVEDKLGEVALFKSLATWRALEAQPTAQ